MKLSDLRGLTSGRHTVTIAVASGPLLIDVVGVLGAPAG